MKKTPLLVASARCVGFVGVVLASSYVAWKDLANWHLMNNENPGLPPNLSSFTSVWGPAFAFFLVCMCSVVGCLSLLRDIKSTRILRMILEFVYVGLVLYTLTVISKVVYFCYNPYHSGPSL